MKLPNWLRPHKPLLILLNVTLCIHGAFNCLILGLWLTGALGPAFDNFLPADIMLGVFMFGFYLGVFLMVANNQPARKVEPK